MLNRLVNAYLKLPECPDWRWLPQSPSESILVCIGAGPWAISRREKVQRDAMESAFNGKDDFDIRELSPTTTIYPLEWQNRMLQTLIKYHRRSGSSFNQVVSDLRMWPDYRHSTMMFFSMFGGRQYKVLWMFLRDFMNLPAFPIDRHVRKFLQENELPVDPMKMRDLCIQAGIDACDMNRRIFGARASNPDWRNWK
jgi:hypothetical protein